MPTLLEDGTVVGRELVVLPAKVVLGAVVVAAVAPVCAKVVGSATSVVRTKADMRRIMLGMSLAWTMSRPNLMG